MKPGWVLNEEDRNRRFRKTIEKKRMMAEEATTATATSTTTIARGEGGHSSDPEDYQCPPRPPPVPHQPRNGRMMGLRLQADLARYFSKFASTFQVLNTYLLSP